MRDVVSDFSFWWEDARLLYSAPLRWNGRQVSQAFAAVIVVLFAMLVDSIVRAAFAYLHASIADTVFGWGHWYGTGKATLYLFLLLYIGGLVLRQMHARILGMLVAESYVFSGILTTGIKSLLGRWRPYAGHGSLSFVPFTTGPNDHLSLPSGDATVAFALSAVMAGMIENRLWKIAWYGIAVVTALSRIYHDQHWLSDVLLSTIIGTTVGVWLVNKHLVPLRAEPEDV